MQGRQGIVTSVSGDVVYAEVNGENWRVHAARPLARGDHVRVTGMDGLTLLVEPANARSSDYEPDGGNHHVL
jgi:membrane-bound serine protease (ClpP class)